MTQTTTLNPRRVETPHEVTDDAKLEAIVNSMTRNGWTGAPIIIVNRDDADPLAVTGSHRIAAARDTNTDIPAVDLADLLAAHGTNLAELVADYTSAGFHEDDALNEVIVRLYEWLPTDVIDTYGIDAH